MEKINLECLEYLEENNIAKESLPKSIKGKMNSLSGLVKRYENKPTQKTKEAIKRIDIAVADLIADWVEQEFPEKFEETPNSIEEQIEVAAKEIEDTPPPAPVPTPEPKAVETTPTPEPKAAEPKTPETKPEPTPIPTPKPTSETEKKVEEMVAEIKKNLNAENRIKVSVLTAIIGKTPSYPTQVVGDLKLKRGFFLNNYYELVG